jgi:hypothetical protein
LRSNHVVVLPLPSDHRRHDRSNETLTADHNRRDTFADNGRRAQKWFAIAKLAARRAAI